MAADRCRPPAFDAAQSAVTWRCREGLAFCMGTQPEASADNDPRGQVLPTARSSQPLDVEKVHDHA